LLSQDKLGAVPSGDFYEMDHAKNNLPDCLERWANRESTELQRKRTDQSFCIPKADIVAQGYDLSLNRYKEVVHDETEHRAPAEIIAHLEKLEVEIQQGLADLKALLG
jgi:type I restriction enzyme M protein